MAIDFTLSAEQKDYAGRWVSESGLIVIQPDGRGFYGKRGAVTIDTGKTITFKDTDQKVTTWDINIPPAVNTGMFEGKWTMTLSGQIFIRKNTITE